MSVRGALACSLRVTPRVNSPWGEPCTEFTSFMVMLFCSHRHSSALIVLSRYPEVHASHCLPGQARSSLIRTGHRSRARDVPQSPRREALIAASPWAPAAAVPG
ncbi:hypothetical protein AAFF_G00106200 [Aldrovandia affinis]|uniref:Uncharacterized protein n=1 Tax=Aldrovandia affinis TaxID=143900 RepID=A0AAD7WXX7_9TELE|nr:hypothetical protein AAFF_G00106200 [Aldrovandia affinis]